jgi:hypothetical protein
MGGALNALYACYLLGGAPPIIGGGGAYCLGGALIAYYLGALFGALLALL